MPTPYCKRKRKKKKEKGKKKKTLKSDSWA